MNKKKLVSLCLVLALVVTAAIGGTMAYFTDKDAQTNTFVTGNVDIDLWEDFDNDGDGLEKLMPATYDEKGKLKSDNVVEKEVYVDNMGSEDAYVRVHIAFPSMLDSGSEDEPQFAAYNNTLHWNFTKASFADGKWNWNIDKNGANYPGNGGDWNVYQETIDGITYNVYVATYETALSGKNGDNIDTTVNAISQVYLDSDVTNEMINEINDVLGANWHVYVAAEGTQAAGFDNAYEALNTSFGVPGEYNVNWEAVSGKTFVNVD